MAEGMKLRLKCGKCGRSGAYDVGTVFVHKESDDPHQPMEEFISFGGYFRCKKCKSAWPWELAPLAKLSISAALFRETQDEENPQVVIGKMQLFDGATSRSPAWAEDYLLGILEREPENWFVWNRLGNIYYKYEMVPKAEDAFRKALEINPDDLESHLSLGTILYEKRKFKQAEEQFHKALILAPHDKDIPLEKKRGFVRHALETLYDMVAETDGEISLLPDIKPEKPDRPDGEPPIVYLTEFDLSKEREWERLVDFALGILPEHVERQMETIRSRKTGRNEPCPCGSGKKSKKCCLA